jgi:HEAT repeat protein
MSKAAAVRALAALALAAAGLHAAEEGLKTSFGPEGLATLSYQGVGLLAKGAVQVSAADASGKGLALKLVGGAPARVEGGTVTLAYEGLTVVCAMSQERDALRLAVTFRNTGAATLSRVTCVPFTFRFPKRPKGGRWMWGYRAATENDGEPGIVEADWGAAKVFACVEDIERPVTFGFDGNYGNSDVNALLIETPKRSVLNAGEERAWRFSLRFAPAGAALTNAAKDIYEQFAKAYPFVLNWPDRRPIGALFLGRDNTKWPKNPRGWFNDEKLDITTDEGRKSFRERLLKYADGSIVEVKKTGGQGVIVWDIEGDQMPHAITYLGDPRVLPQEAPEMDAVADEFFKKFLDAGLRTGICIRPSKVIPDGKGGWKHQQVDDHVADMADKIAYAKKRWGCTIVYMDTNVKWPLHRLEEDATRGMWQGDAWLLPSRDLHELCRRHPDTLIFPEFGRFGYWGCCMPYGELRGGRTRTGDDIRAAYPKAGTVITVGDGDYLGQWDSLRAGVAAGDLHLFRGWFGDPVNQHVTRLYREADLLRRHAGAAPRTGNLDALLDDADPLARFGALQGLARPDAEQAALIAKRLPAEQDWLVQKRMIEALGASGGAAAVPVLADLLKDPKRGLDCFAARALGRIGPPATAALVELAAAKDPRIAEQALLALAGYEDPKAEPAVLAAAGDARPALRKLAARALGRQKTPAAAARLIELLRDKDRGVVSEACGALGQLKDRTAIEPLVDLIERAVKELRDNDVRLAAGQALEAITGREHGPFEQRWRKDLKEGRL